MEAFTNRQLQWELVAAALSEHLRLITESAFDVEDLERPRHNVMVFHGVGGIGKTTLSRKLEAALAGADQRPAQWGWGEPAWSGQRILPVRIDLARSAGTSFEDVVLTLRAALAELGRPLPAFDIALRRYWETQHPGEPLEDCLRRGGLAGRFGKAMPQQMQSALADVAQALLLPGTVGTAAGAPAGSPTRALRERRQTVRALAECAPGGSAGGRPGPGGAELLPAPACVGARPAPGGQARHAGDPAGHLRGRRRPYAPRPGAPHPAGRVAHAELLLRHHRPQWADAALQGQLDYTGPAAWPHLALPAAVPADGAARPPHGHARQVLIGDFSPEDCDDHLARRLTRDGEPLISEEIRQAITGRSHGLPLYLDLSVMRFLEIRRTGRNPAPADFDHDSPP
ncbi:hypothetical protein [Streptomyces mirabilis]|uniref:hypothetical protein n=1 Tax=Streptomyces mirabilis TaxID=68239 RepID=UPI0036AA92E8